MPVLQVRELPLPLYRKLKEKAELERRSLSQEAVVVLAKGLKMESDAKARRARLLAEIFAEGAPPAGLPDPVRLIREDRDR